MSPIAEHHYDQALAFLMDSRNSNESRNEVSSILISMAMSDREIFKASEEEFIKIRMEIFNAIVEYKKEINSLQKE